MRIARGCDLFKEEPDSGRVFMDGDPHALLSPESLLHIRRARKKEEAIRDVALAKINARCGSADPRDWDGFARQQWSAAKMDAAYHVLAAMAREFRAVVRSDVELREIMDGELESASNSLELSEFESAAVWSKLLQIRPDPNGTGKIVAIGAGRSIASAPENVDYATPAARNNAIESYMQAWGIPKRRLAAQKLGVEYTDLNTWKLHRSARFAKSGHSVKATRIEGGLHLRPTQA
jgi:hypothetical protein